MARNLVDAARMGHRRPCHKIRRFERRHRQSDRTVPRRSNDCVRPTRSTSPPFKGSPRRLRCRVDPRTIRFRAAIAVRTVARLVAWGRSGYAVSFTATSAWPNTTSPATHRRFLCNLGRCQLHSASAQFPRLFSLPGLVTRRLLHGRSGPPTPLPLTRPCFLPAIRSADRHSKPPR